MKTILPILLALIILTGSCEKADTSGAELRPGTYTGVFFRSSPTEKYATSDVTLVFNNNTFEGSSSVVKYPAVCKGSYKVTGQEIEFINTCPWTAEFDWSYILTGKFNLEVNGDEIIITRSYGEFTYDTYTLSRQ